MRTKTELLKLIEAQQEIQMTNKYTSQAWQDASKELHRLIEEMTGRKPQDAIGKR